MSGEQPSEEDRPRWTFLTNHAHVLLCLARNDDLPLREVADAVGITLRATQSIVADLEAAGYLERRRHGRQNTYALHPDQPLRHPLERDHAIGELLDLLTPQRPRRTPRART
jgi:hypothetical protein